jgi:uncharacterized membrane protein YqjE
LEDASLSAEKDTNKSDEGLLHSLKSLSTTLIAILYNRLDLLSIDLEEARERLLSLLMLTIVSLFCLCLGMVLLAMLVVVVFWETHRLLALVTLAGFFLVSGAILSMIAMRALRNMPRVFSASLSELSKDHELLDPLK